MQSPINIADSLVLILFIIGIFFLKTGIDTNNSVFLLLGVIELMLAVVQNMINKNQFMFK